MNPSEAGRLRPGVERLEDRTLPSSYQLTPVIPTIDAAEAARLGAVVQRGMQLGNRLNVFARAGDSITIASQFLTPLNQPSVWASLAGNPSLLQTLAFFQSAPVGGGTSFTRTSTAAHGGWKSSDVLAALPGELAADKPAFVLVMVGTNDISAGVPVEVFRQNLTAIVQTALNAGVVPVLSTIPDMLLAPVLEAHQPAFNQTIQDVADALQVPLWNYWRALQRLPALGISADLIHPSVSPLGGGDLTPFGLQFGYNVRNLTALQTLDKLKQVLLQRMPPDPPSAAAGWQPLTAASLPVAAGDTTGFQVQVLDAASRRVLFAFDPFPGYGGSVRVATGDVNADGVPDLIAAAGPGGPPHVKAFDGRTGALLASFYAFAPALTSGLSVAAGDVDGDGRAEIVVCPEENTAAHVEVFTGGGQLRASFYAFDPAFRGGGRVVAADVNRDGHAEIIVAAGRGGQGHVAVFGGPGLKLESSFLAFGPGYGGDVSLAAGDFDGDGAAEVAVGMGAGAPPVVEVYRPLAAAPVAVFLAYPPGYPGGVHLAAVDRGRGRADLVAASDGTALADVRVYDAFSSALLGGIALYEVGFRRGVSFGN